jgi:hypothetical protein
MFFDWVFQSQWQANNKSKWSKKDNTLISFAAVLSHSAFYALSTTLVTLWLLGDMKAFWPVLITLFVSHFIIDTRIPVRAIMKAKGLTRDQINDHQTYGFMEIGIDQRLHEIVLLIIAIFI